MLTISFNLNYFIFLFSYFFIYVLQTLKDLQNHNNPNQQRKDLKLKNGQQSHFGHGIEQMKHVLFAEII